jgi:hypothetical protein
MRIFIHILTVFFLAINNFQAGLAGTREPKVPDDKYVEFGTEFHSIARIKLECEEKLKTEDGELITVHQTGSAVIIKPNWVLTAAHVFDGAVGDPVIVLDSGKEVKVTKVIRHEEFDHDKLGWHDIALCYTPEDFKLPFYTPLYTDADEIGKPVTISGYGSFGTFHEGGKFYDGKRRAGHNVIDHVERGVLICTPSQGAGAMKLEFLIAPGDSGGGLFIGDKLAGISSFIAGVGKVFVAVVVRVNKPRVVQNVVDEGRLPEANRVVLPCTHHATVKVLCCPVVARHIADLVGQQRTILRVIHVRQGERVGAVLSHARHDPSCRSVTDLFRQLRLNASELLTLRQVVGKKDWFATDTGVLFTHPRPRTVKERCQSVRDRYSAERLTRHVRWTLILGNRPQDTQVNVEGLRAILGGFIGDNRAVIRYNSAPQGFIQIALSIRKQAAYRLNLSGCETFR